MLVEVPLYPLTVAKTAKPSQSIAKGGALATAGSVGCYVGEIGTVAAPLAATLLSPLGGIVVGALAATGGALCEATGSDSTGAKQVAGWLGAASEVAFEV